MTILRGVVGSSALGIESVSGDRDEMGIFIEDRSSVYGVDGPDDHRIYRDAGEGERSKPGDLDLTLYSLRKFCRLAMKGNPSILMLLYLPEYIVLTGLGRDLLEIRSAFVSKDAGKAFLGYLRSQKAKLCGERSPAVSRPELVARYGYDVKFAGHAVRLGMQGIEYLAEGELTLPLRQADLITAIRRGELTLSEVLDMVGDIEARLLRLVDECVLCVDKKRIDDFMLYAHEVHWKLCATLQIAT